MKTFGDWIRETREAKGFNANFCARRAGMHESVWSNWENGRSRRKDGEPTQPRPETVRAIAKGLGVPEEQALIAAYGKDHTQNAKTSDKEQVLDISQFVTALDAEDRDEILQIMQMKWKRKHPESSPPMVSTLDRELFSHRFLRLDLDEGYLYGPDGTIVNESRLLDIGELLGQLSTVYVCSTYSMVEMEPFLADIRVNLGVPPLVTEMPDEAATNSRLEADV